MKIRITLDVDDELRRAMAHRYGQPGMVSREDIVNDALGNLESIWTDYLTEYRADQEEAEE